MVNIKFFAAYVFNMHVFLLCFFFKWQCWWFGTVLYPYHADVNKSCLVHSSDQEVSPNANFLYKENGIMYCIVWFEVGCVSVWSPDGSYKSTLAVYVVSVLIPAICFCSDPSVRSQLLKVFVCMWKFSPEMDQVTQFSLFSSTLTLCLKEF